MIRRNSHKHAKALVIDVLLAIGLLAGTFLPGLAQSGTWRKTGNTKIASEPAQPALLPNGQVLVADGEGNTSLIADAELHNPRWLDCSARYRQS